jgi:hypothetical protein
MWRPGERVVSWIAGRWCPALVVSSAGDAREGTPPTCMYCRSGDAHPAVLMIERGGVLVARCQEALSQPQRAHM